MNLPNRHVILIVTSIGDVMGGVGDDTYACC